jgi:hypothetical protein
MLERAMDLVQSIRDAIQRQEFLVSIHAQRQMRSRMVELWQVEGGVDDWKVLEERPDDLPNPSIVCMQSLPDGTEVKVVWAWYPEESKALLVTVHYLDR